MEVEGSAAESLLGAPGMLVPGALAPTVLLVARPRLFWLYGPLDYQHYLVCYHISCMLPHLITHLLKTIGSKSLFDQSDFAFHLKLPLYLWIFSAQQPSERSLATIRGIFLPKAHCATLFGGVLLGCVVSAQVVHLKRKHVQCKAAQNERVNSGFCSLVWNCIGVRAALMIGKSTVSYLPFTPKRVYLSATANFIII